MCSTDCEICRRLRYALIDLLGQQGLRSLAMEDLTARAAVTGELSAHRCGTLAACALAAYDEASEQLYELCTLVLLRDAPWGERSHEMMAETIRLFTDRPGLMRLSLVESEGACISELPERRATQRQRFVRLIASAYERSGEPEPPPALHFELLAGAAFRMLQTEFLAGRFQELRGVPPQLEQLMPAFEPAV